jgi:hypothetical protein
MYWVPSSIVGRSVTFTECFWHENTCFQASDLQKIWDKTQVIFLWWIHRDGHMDWESENMMGGRKWSQGGKIQAMDGERRVVIDPVVQLSMNPCPCFSNTPSWDMTFLLLVHVCGHYFWSCIPVRVRRSPLLKERSQGSMAILNRPV